MNYNNPFSTSNKINNPLQSKTQQKPINSSPEKNPHQDKKVKEMNIAQLIEDKLEKEEIKTNKEKRE